MAIWETLAIRKRSYPPLRQEALHFDFTRVYSSIKEHEHISRDNYDNKYI